MNALIIAAYGLYLVMVGFNQNSKQLLDYIERDAGGFFPWAVSIAVLSVAYNNQYAKKVVEPFIVLATVTFILKNFTKLQNEYNKINQSSKGK